jgi:AraC family carnitine catabolism transcriptional activator
MDTSVRSFGFFVAPKFSMMSLLSMTEPLRAASEIAGREIYRLTFFGEREITTAINGMSIATVCELPRSAAYDAIVVCASYSPEMAASAKVHSWLRWLDAHGVVIGSADTGAYVLARAGLLSKCEVALHWVNLPPFREIFPDIKTTSRLISFSERRFSCAGATTGIDMMLKILADHHGADFAAKVSNHFNHVPEEGRPQREQTALSELFLQIREPAVRKVLRMMENCDGDRWLIADLALEAGMSVKQLERAFKREIGQVPAQVYQRIRLNKARYLLLHTSLSIEEIAEKCGFASRSQFSRVYKSLFGMAPRASRKASP